VRKLLVAICALVALGVGAGGVMLLQRYDVYAVRTGSMAPAAPARALVLTERQDAYGVGDIVTYDLAPGRPLTHRIVGVDAGGAFRTRGDANPFSDPWLVPPEAVRGATVHVLPGIGFLFVYLQQPAGVASVMAALLTLVLGWRLLFAPPPVAAAVPVRRR
jgi:signal peptidase I